MSGERTKEEVEVYHDVEGTERTLYEMLKVEPEWAVSRIKAGERAVKNNDRLVKALKAVMKSYEEYRAFDGVVSNYPGPYKQAREALARMEKEEK